MRIKLEKLSKIHARLWKIQSRYIRLRDGKCVTCEETKNLQASHYLHGNIFDFNDVVVNAQCIDCHCLFGKNRGPAGMLVKDKYREYLVNKWGSEIIDGLTRQKHNIFKPTREYYRQIEIELNDKLALLLASKV